MLNQQGFFATFLGRALPG